MAFHNLSLTASAVLVWLPDGSEPNGDDFQTHDDKSLAPPYPNPEAWWELREAIFYAQEVDHPNNKKVPWIKTGDSLLSPSDILNMYETLKAKS